MGDVKTIIQKWIAILIILVLFMGQYAITGFLATSYAIDLLATQSENVQFRAYFKNGQEELTEIQKSIDSKDLKLNIAVAVKNQGYFNGQISLANAGFKLDEATTNNYISKIENNVIYLKQINAEETANIEVGIKYFEEDKIQASTLNQTTTVKLNGTYTGSNGNTTIDSGSDVKVIWNIPENTKAELASKIQTNSAYSVNGENKKIVQFLTSSKLTNNAYPVKNTQITATIPAGATNIEVHKRTTKATNGEQEFTSANYNVENNVLTINVNNTETEGNISWMKGVLDIFVVTYEYPESVELSEQTITVNEKITAQNNTELNAEQVQLTLTETKDGIASVSKQEKESSIYKGKIYSGEGRDYTSYTLVYVDYASGVSSMEITEIGGMYGKEVNQFSIGRTDSTIFGNYNLIKNVKVNKEKVASVLGNTWELTIGNNTITNETEADSNGDITVQLPDKTDNVTIKTSKPVNNGSFIIETTKNLSNIKNPSLGNTEKYTREELKEFKNIADMAWIEKNNIQSTDTTYLYNITLKDTETNASLQSEQTALIAGSNSQSLNLTAVLETKGEHQDLYKNPEIKIKLPSQVKNVSFAQKPQLIQANGLELTDENYKVIEENGQKALSIKLTGEQTNYPGQAVQGTTISIKTNVEIDKNAQNSQEEIVMTYTNENATKYTDNGTEKVNVQISAAQAQSGNEDGSTGSGSQSGNQGSSTGNEGQGTGSGTQQTANAELQYEVSASVGGKAIANGDIVKAGEIITYTAKITNPSSEEKTGLKIEANVPENTTLIQVNPKYPKLDEVTDEYIDGEDYYSKLENNEVKQENISIEAGKVYSYTFMVMVNENITEEKNIEEKIKFSENNVQKEEKTIVNKISPAKFSLICMPIDRRPNEKLVSGFSYTYGIEIKNLTNEEQNNVKLLLNISDALNINSIDWYLDEKEIGKIQLENNILNFESIPANKTAKIYISATVTAIKENENKLVLSKMQAQLTDSEGIKYNSNELIDTIEGVLINVEASSKATTKVEKQGYVSSGDIITYTYKIRNTGTQNADELEITNNFSRYLSLDALAIDGKNYEYEKIELNTETAEYDEIKVNKGLEVGKEMTLEITGKVINNLPSKDSLKITNKLSILSKGAMVAETNEIVYNIEAKSGESEDTSGDNNSNTNTEDNHGSNVGDNSEDINIPNKNAISGTAWLDSNTNGQRDSNETLLDGIKATLFDIEKNEEVSSTTTNSNGIYYFTNVTSGKYVVIFDYDTEKYRLTTYQAEGVSSTDNSDVENVTMTINGENKRVASTDTLTLNEDSITNIDIGLTEAKKFDLSLAKTISKVSVSNTEGNKTVDFSDTNLAKVEIKGKYLKGSVVMVEYKIRVTNNGEVAGYAKKIVDYKPAELKFNSKLNPDWYKSGNELYTESIANEIIDPGETKEITLVLTKTMTASNTGLTNNKAEIDEYYNSQGIVDENGEKDDDVSQADLIVSVSTGAAVKYIIITLIISLILASISYVIIKKIIILNTTI